MIVLAWICFVCAAVPASLFLWNLFLFREPAALKDPSETFPAISVLIPARNEEQGIQACVSSILASRCVELEVIVLDDHSTDRTAEVVRQMGTADPRLRLEQAPTLPPGWCGKQHACFVLSKMARHEIITFLDADVRLAPDALARMASFLQETESELVSGFPRQETGSLLEQLLIPLINWLLLCFLPLFGMRICRRPGFGAGCGQWFMTTRTAYDKVGGHAAIRSSLHDGLMLPRAYRRNGFMTDLCDARNLASCRMYRSNRAVWLGLAKNAREGMAATDQIGFWTTVLVCGQVLPTGLLIAAVAMSSPAWSILAATVSIGFFVRCSIAWRFDASVLGCLLHPAAIGLLIALQWYAIGLAVLGKPVGWKGRENPLKELPNGAGGVIS